MSQNFTRRLHITACVDLEEHLKFASDVEDFLLNYPKAKVTSLNVNYYLSAKEDKK